MARSQRWHPICGLALGLAACASEGAPRVDTGADAADAAMDTAGDVAPDAGTGACDDPALVWRTGMKTHYASYPAPGSEECIAFSGCDYVGQFAACANTMPERWVAAHDLAAVFPLGELAMHRLCLRAGGKTLIVTAVDTCADSDCSGCCSENRASADALIDLESYTDQRWGVDDGPLTWADLGPGDPSFDGCN